MRKAAIFFVCLSVLLAVPVGCFAKHEFLNPLYTQQDLTTDRLLSGIWVQKSGNAALVLEFQSGKTGCYDLNIKVVVPDTTDPDLQEKANAMAMKLNACLLKLGEMVFLDVQPKTVPVGATAETFYLATSTGFKHKNPFSPSVLEIEGRVGDTDLSGLFVTLAPVPGQDGPGAQSEYELRLTPAHWISRVWISEKKLRLSDFDPDDDVATLSTRELQKLVLKYADDRDSFDDVEEFKRKEGESR